LCFVVSGDCINSSPAGKRRIAAEKQLSQLADEANQFSNDAALIDGADVGVSGFKDQIQSTPVLVLIAAAVICSAFVIVFVSIFVVLQVSVNAKNCAICFPLVRRHVILMMVQHLSVL
jgi:hypothetical protein